MKEQDISLSEVLKWPINPGTQDILRHIQKITLHKVTRHNDTEDERFVFIVPKKYTPLFTLGVMNRLHEAIRRYYKEVLLIELKLPDEEIVIKEKVIRKKRYAPKMEKKEIYKTSPQARDVYVSIG